MIKKKLPIGIESFEMIRTEDFYYIDKTGFIAELLHNWGKVNLFTRPRRFGKSLNMSMLKSFFEIGCDRKLFDGLQITGERDLCEEYMGKFPVISVSFKGVNGSNFGTARAMMGTVIGNEALRFGELKQSSKLSEPEKKRYEALTHVGKTGSFDMPDEVLMNGLATLSTLVQKHYGKKVVILIDEYDVPLDKANENGYYDEMILLIRNIFGQALKTNEALHFAVLTGCLRVARESIFTGMNNLKILSVSDVRFDEYFGFTDKEVKEMLDYYGLLHTYNTVKEWYDGYRFGNTDVYCPWDVINYCDELRADNEAFPKDYWSNTSSNDIVKRFIEMSGTETLKREIENLVAGETVSKEIYQELTYKDLYSSIDNIWSVLFTTGYLTQRGKAEGNIFQLAIPNMEIRNIFTRQIMEFFRKNVENDGDTLNRFCQALENGDPDKVESIFTDYLRKTISIRDTFVRKGTKENFYHGILLGLLGFKQNWIVSSNKESGDGYSDIFVEICDKDTGLIIEVKYAHNMNLEEGCQKALEQIEKERYEEELRDEGINRILKYGIACYKKRCKVVLADRL